MKVKSIKSAALAALAATAALTMAACVTPQQGAIVKPVGEVTLPSNIQLTVPYSPGGGTDTWARFIAPYLEEHVEDGPHVIVENAPGGESITGSNAFVRTGGSDGETLLVTSGTTYFQALLGRPEVEFDFAKMRPLILNGTGGAVYVAASTGIKSVKDLVNYDKPLVYGGISATGLDLTLLQAMDVLGKDLKATFGFEGRGPARLALERGELTLDYQTTSAFKTQVQPMVDAGVAVPLFSFGVLKDGKIVRDPSLPDLPTLEEAYESINNKAPRGKAYDAYRAFLVPGYLYQKGIWANEGTPDGIVDAIRKAAAKIATDEKFLAASEDVLGGYPLIPGDVAEADLVKAFTISDDVRQYALNMLAEKYNTKVESK